MNNKQTTLNYKELKKEFLAKQKRLDREQTISNVVKALQINETKNNKALKGRF